MCVVAPDEQLDLLLEFPHAGERVAADGALGDQHEPALDLFLGCISFVLVADGLRMC